VTKRTNALAWIATLTLAACAASTTQAKFVMTLQQNGANVDGIGNGSIDLTDFGSTPGSARNVTELAPNASVLAAGSSDAPGPDVNLFNGAVTAPSNFGPGGMTLGESIGDPIFVSSITIGVPIGYAFGAPLSNRSFYIGESFASLGVNPGSTYGAGAREHTRTRSCSTFSRSDRPLCPSHPPGRWGSSASQGSPMRRSGVSAPFASARRASTKVSGAACFRSQEDRASTVRRPRRDALSLRLNRRCGARPSRNPLSARWRKEPSRFQSEGST
jgi:hypothetical protein